MVTQGDREAAADLLDEISALLDHVGIGQVADLIRDGEYDEHEATLAFAAHRIAALEEAAKVADEKYRGHGQTLGTARAHNYEHAALLIASQIRNLKGAGA